jgi:hypothetical protein
MRVCQEKPRNFLLNAKVSISRRYRPVHTSSRQHNILYLGLDVSPLILHTNSRQCKNVLSAPSKCERQIFLVCVVASIIGVR